ncbi:hypothetical protein [Sorangium cellulosum]|uniref:Uncharacterized protein n=1 Tax=Sorangium cellulosum So0157-2 TaxID=1254432 RepID=S4YF47_SORCE|nr:hypothetical protein [Sorangium cellulosum]AGP41513.1 hypothetical protein SCE1572_47725 [Sorangium cellulosum So0157-2]
MSNALFTSELTYTPGGGGALTQSFRVTAPYTAISAGTLDIPDATASGQAFVIPFGGVNTDARGLVIKNNTGLDIGIRLNGAAANIYQLAAGGVFMHWAPAAAAAGALTGASVTTTAATTGPGTVDYIVLGS